ncbi:unnamed protein product [Durusdinium trenchii]|uniref:Pentatricopeptide repeat-containing protein, chloroplastic n=1 Tax=Durusdinium trenchii TaxID=1381693 RepID=A0ABP0P4S9_9DINO
MDADVKEARRHIASLGRTKAWRAVLQTFLDFPGADGRLNNAAAAACTRGLAWSSALELLQAIPRAALRGNQVTFNTAATAFEKGSQWQKAVSLLHAAGADVVTFSAACSALARGAPDGWQLPLELLRSFQQRSLEFDVVFCASVLSACEKGPRWEIGIELLDWMRSSLDLPLNLFCFGAAISACRKGSNWQGAWALLEDIWSSALQPDLVAFNATISSCEKAQRWEFAIELLEMMSLQQVPPDVVSFNATASACEKRAQWSWALWVFSQLKRTIPVEKQKGALLNISNACVSACAKALRWQEALLLGQQIDRPDKVTYNGLLCACRASGGSRWPMLLQLVIEMSRHLVMPGVDA